jgi:hypothetical protein
MNPASDQPRPPLPRLAPPPRSVPWTLAIRQLFGGSGGFAVFAWIWFGMGSSAAIGFLRRDASEGPAILLVMIFPIVGLTLVAFSLRQGLRQLRLLSHGRLALGTLIGNEPTNVRINKRTVRKLRFAIETETRGRCEVEVRSHVPEKALDEPRERILYDPERPGAAAAWDLLVGTPRLDGSGELEPAGFFGSAVLLIPPALAVLGHLVALGLVFG